MWHRFVSGIVLAVSMVSGAWSLAAEAHLPNEVGLVMWVDAANTASVVTDPQQQVLTWKDLSGNGRDLFAGDADAKTRPLLVADAFNKKPAIRFSGAQSLSMMQPIRPTVGSGAVLVVWQRSAAQVSDEKWQRLVSSRHDSAKADNQLPNFCMAADDKGEGTACEVVISDLELSDMSIGALVVGKSASGGAFLKGDIAEILVYDRAFMSEGQLQESLAYLKEKWHARVGREQNGWTRVGELGPTPAHTRQDLPLSDQENADKWALDTRFCDEFDGASLDLQKWHVNPVPGDWLGDKPALFDPANVELKDGMLHMWFRKGDVPAMKGLDGFQGYTAALIQTREMSGYGYYETRARPMSSAASSTFWLTNWEESKDNQTEIDVFEIGGKARGFDHKYNMTAHIWRTPQEKRHWFVGGVWLAPFKPADSFHVYGFEWNKDELKWYVDGVLTRKAKNTNWFFPMHIVFADAAAWAWFGPVDDADLPSSYDVDYLRVWRKAE